MAHKHTHTSQTYRQTDKQSKPIDRDSKREKIITHSTCQYMSVHVITIPYRLEHRVNKE